MATITVSSDANYSSLGINDGDRITITQGATVTIDTDTQRLERINCTTFGTCFIHNTSVTTPIFINMGEDGTTDALLRFESGGILRAQGAWITLGISDGTAGQSFTLPTNHDGEHYQALAGLQIVDGSDTILYNRVDSLADKFFDDKLGCVYTHDESTNTITFGDSTTGGYIPPSGAIIRIPNIQFRNEHQGSGTIIFDLASSGTADLETVSFAHDYNLDMSSGSSVMIRNVCVDSPHNTINIGVLSSPSIENIVVVSQIAPVITGSGCNNIALNGFRVYATNVTAAHQIQLSNGGGGHIQNGVIISENAEQSSSRGALYFTSANIDVTNVYIASRLNGVYFSSGSGGSVLRNIYYTADGNRANVAGNKGRYAFYAANSANNRIEHCGFHPQSEAEGLVAPYTSYMNLTTGSAHITCNAIAIWCGSASSAARMAQPITINGADHRIGNVTIYGDPSGDTINHSTGSLNPEIVNVTFNDPETQANDIEWCDGAFYELVATPDKIEPVPSNSGIDVASLLLRRSNSPQSAYLYRMMGQDSTLGLYTEITRTGVVAFDNNGTFYMGNMGDVVAFETHIHRGIESIQGAILEGTNVSNFSCRFAMRVPNGTYSEHQNFTAANMDATLQTLPNYHVNEGVQIKYEITRSASNLSDTLKRIRLECTIEAGYAAPFEVDPTSLIITNTQPGDAIYIEGPHNNQKAYHLCDGFDFILPLPNINAGETWVYVVKRPGYEHQKGTFTVPMGENITLSVSMVEKQQAVGGSMYTASDVASVDVNFDLAAPQMDIDISQSQTSPQNVFDKIERALITNDGMRWLAKVGTDTAFQNLGGAGSFLFHQHNIRLRRNTPADSNAEVLAFVFSTDGIAVNEAHGTVAIFSGTLVKDVWEGLIDDYDDVSDSFGKAIAEILTAITEKLDAPVSQATQQAALAAALSA